MCWQKWAENTPERARKREKWEEFVRRYRTHGLPDSEDEECYVLTIWSENGETRASIWDCGDRSFTVQWERLCPFDEEDLLYTSGDAIGYWCPLWRNGVSFYDSPETALRELKAYPPFREDAEGKP